jgi:hypothetical protein
MAQLKRLWFILRREPYYHKIQYAKVPKYDGGAAVLGVGVGALVGYVALSTLGSGGTDLSDLTVVCWYVWLGYGCWVQWGLLQGYGLYKQSWGGVGLALFIEWLWRCFDAY